MGIARTAQAEFAALSFVKAAIAQKQGKFMNEIVPITVKFVDPKARNELKIVRNSSQVSSGATAVLLARRSVANKPGPPDSREICRCSPENRVCRSHIRHPHVGEARNYEG